MRRQSYELLGQDVTNPLNPTPTAVLIPARQQQIHKYHINAQNNCENQITRDSDTLCESKRNDKIGSFFTHKC